MTVPVGEVRVADDKDFASFKHMCVSVEGWTCAYNKRGIRVWTKKNDVCSSFKIVKVHSIFTDISAEVMYDVLHDPDYRKVWDDYMLLGEDICYINPNNDIGYYAAKSPQPLRNRDFVTQRSFLEDHGEYLIMNHSVNHASRPITKKFVRGISYLTGYYVIAKEDGACELYYISQCDLRGRVPSWVINKVSHRVAPSIVTKLHKVAKGYPAWKAVNRPDWKPWLNPEQISLPKINWADVKSMDEVLNSEVIDERTLLDDHADSSDQASVNGE